MDYAISLEDHGFPVGAKAHVFEPKWHRRDVEIYLIPGFLSDTPKDSKESIWSAKVPNEWDYAADRLATSHQARVLVIRWPSKSVMELLAKIELATAGIPVLVGAVGRVLPLIVFPRLLMAPATALTFFPWLRSLWNLKSEWDQAVAQADETSKALGSFVVSRSSEHVCFVGHSLGGRICIKVLEAAPNHQAQSFSSIALAPAVLDNEVSWEDIRPLPHPRIEAYWSYGDLVLAVLFRTGQFTLGSPIGFSGPLPSRQNLVKSVDCTKCGKWLGRGHGDYLGDLEELLERSPIFVGTVGKGSVPPVAEPLKTR